MRDDRPENTSIKAAQDNSSVAFIQNKKFIFLIFFITLILLSTVVYLTLQAQRITQKMNLLAQTQSQMQQHVAQQESQLQFVLNEMDEKKIILNSAKYLIQEAKLNLVTGNNTSLPLYLLMSADRKIATLEDPSYNNVRQALANDIFRLKSVKMTDSSHLIFQLDTLLQEILALLTLPPNFSAPITKKVIAPTSSWRDELKETKDRLKHLVMIRHHRISPTLLLDADAFNTLRANFQFKIYQTEWAVLQQQPELYQHNLQLIQSWIKTYYVNFASTAPVLKEIGDLLNTDIKAPALDFSETLKLLQQHIDAVMTASVENPAAESPKEEPNAPETRPLIKELPRAHESIET